MVNVASLSHFFCKAFNFGAILSYILLSSLLMPVLWIRKDLFQILIQQRIWMVMSHFILSMISDIEPCYPVQDPSCWVILSTAGTLLLSRFIGRNPDLEPISSARSLTMSHFIGRNLETEPFHLQKSWNWSISSAGSLMLSHFIGRMSDIEPFQRQDVWYWAISSAGSLTPAPYLESVKKNLFIL